MKHHATASILALAALIACGGENDPAPISTETDLFTRELVMVDSIGVELGDSNYIFGSIEGLGFTGEGNIAVLDRVSADIRVYSPDGRMLRRIGGRGSGPGEMYNPISFFIFPDGRFGAMDPWKSGLLTFSSQGEYLGMAMDLSQNAPIFPRVVDDSSFIALKTELIPNPGSVPEIAVFVGLFHMSTEPSVTYFREVMSMDLATFADVAQKYLLAFPFQVDTERRLLYIAPFSGTDYVIERYSLEGELLGTMELEVESVPLTDEEIRLEEMYISQKLASLEGGDPDYNIELIDPIDHRIPVTDLEIGPEGNLWARRGTEDEPFFDVWSSDGELIGSVVMPGVGPGSRSWNFQVSPLGILAYDEDPDYYQKIYIIHLPEQPGDSVPSQ